MAKVQVFINGVSYNITCDDGQEDRLSELAAFFDVHVRRLAEEVGDVSDSRLMLLAGLTISDELLEAKQALDNVESQTGLTSSDNAAHIIEDATQQVSSLAQDFDKLR